MSWDVRKHQGAIKEVVAGFATEAEAKADALARCTSPETEYVVFDAKSNEVGRAIFDTGTRLEPRGTAYWQAAP
jgi:hypothetical protein